VHRRWWVGIGSAATVVLAGVSGGLINELHGGWGWFVAAGAVVLASAIVTAWLAMRTTGNTRH
jgi:Na+/melibiose symporter-like transporter